MAIRKKGKRKKTEANPRACKSDFERQKKAVVRGGRVYPEDSNCSLISGSMHLGQH